mmetsp:Transcript_7436/g.19510  ORF Transcript_7436/g.19510 Transcript_7436/m.19510 type:complete len:346 (+) Transcript_7436:422-1459(+)
MGLIGAVVLAFFWHIVVNDIAVFVIIAAVLGSIVGNLGFVFMLPFAPLFFDEGVVAAISTGNGIGCAVSGALGIVQGLHPPFGTTPFMLSISVVILLAALSWVAILHHGLGIKDPSQQSQQGAKEDALARRVEGEVALDVTGAASKDAPSVRATVIRLGLPIWLIAVPSILVTWAVALPTLSFATAHAGCSCDPTAREPSQVNSLVTGCSFVCMPFGALLAHALPTYSLWKIGALECSQLVLLFFHLLAVAGVPFMSCNRAAEVAIGVIFSLMRFLDTYLIVVLNQLNWRRFSEEADNTRKAAAFAFGIATLLANLVPGLVVFVLLQSKTVRCVELIGLEPPVTH